MEIIKPNSTIQQTPEVVDLKRGFIEKIDLYLRRSDTTLAELANFVTSYKGLEYLNSRVKRCLDLGVAIPAAVLATPVITILGISKKLEDGGPVFFVHQRLAQQEGETVGVVKIRCMRPDSDSGIKNIKISRGLEPSQDPRNTRIGAFMRSYQLEELPQVFQVIQGRLSVLGIRPNTQYGFNSLREMWSEERYNRWVDAYHTSPMGISGLNQVFGSRLKEEEKRYHLDVFYAKNASFGLDLYLLWKTVTRLLGVK